MHTNILCVIAQTISLRSVSYSRLPRRPRVNSFLRLGLQAAGGGHKVFICLDTGRAGGIIGLFCLSRIRFRELTNEGALPGVKKL